MKLLKALIGNVSPFCRKEQVDRSAEAYHVAALRLVINGRCLANGAGHHRLLRYKA